MEHLLTEKKMVRFEMVLKNKTENYLILGNRVMNVAAASNKCCHSGI